MAHGYILKFYKNSFHRRNCGFHKNGIAVSYVRTAGTPEPEYSSDYYLPDEDYERYLKRLWVEPLNQKLVDYLCMQIDNPKSKRSCTLRFIHLQPLFLNPTVKDYELKEFLYDKIKKTRRLWLKLFFIRAYAIHVDEAEMTPVMEKFQKSLCKNHDYVDYEHILSAAGIPYLIKQYGYKCFRDALEVAKKEYQEIHPLLKGFFTLDEKGELIELLTSAECTERIEQF